MKDLRETPTSTGQTERAQLPRRRNSSRLCSSRLAEPDARIDPDPHRASMPAARHAARARAQELRAPPPRRPRTRVRPACRAACPACASRRRSRRVRRRAATSAASKRPGADVVDDRSAGVERGARDRGFRRVDADRRPRSASASPSRRAARAAAPLRRDGLPAPGRVDSPPTSSKCAPCASSSSRARSRARDRRIAAVRKTVGRHVDDAHQARGIARRGRRAPCSQEDPERRVIPQLALEPRQGCAEQIVERIHGFDAHRSALTHDVDAVGFAQSVAPVDHTDHLIEGRYARTLLNRPPQRSRLEGSGLPAEDRIVGGVFVHGPSVTFRGTVWQSADRL